MSAELGYHEVKSAPPILGQLRELGLNDRQSQVYLAVAEHGRVAPASLARKLHIPRSSVYLTLEELSERGLISIHRSKSGMYFTPNNSATVLRLIERELESVQKKKGAAVHVARFLDILSETKDKAGESQIGGLKVPKIQYFKGQKNVENMLIDNLARWRASYTGPTDSGLWGFQDHTFVRHYTAYLNHRWATSLPGEFIRLFSNMSPEEDSLRDRVPNREVRSLPLEIAFRATVWIYGNYLVLIQSDEDPHYAYQLEDPAICANLRAIFQFLWSVTNAPA